MCRHLSTEKSIKETIGYRRTSKTILGKETFGMKSFGNNEHDQDENKYQEMYNKWKHDVTN